MTAQRVGHEKGPRPVLHALLLQEGAAVLGRFGQPRTRRLSTLSPQASLMT